MKREKPISKKVLLVGFLTVLAVLLLAVAYVIARSQEYLVHRDFFAFYVAGHMVAQGEDPYNADQYMPYHDRLQGYFIPDETYLYPLPLAVVFIPIGLLSFPAAATVWTFLTLVMVLASIYVLLPQVRLRNLFPYLIPMLLGLIFFRPLIVTLAWGQVAGFLLFVLVMGAWLWERGLPFWAGVLVGLMVLKPQVGVPVAGLAGLGWLLRGEWRALAGLAACGAGQLLAGMAFNPRWVQDWLSVGQQKLELSFGQSTTIWGVASLVCNHETACATPIAVGLFLALVAGCGLILWRFRTLPPVFMLALVTCVGLLVTPYLLSSDQLVLVFPILVIFGMMYEKRSPYLVTATLFLLFSVLALVSVAPAPVLKSDALSTSLSVVALVLILRIIYQWSKLELRLARLQA